MGYYGYDSLDDIPHFFSSKLREFDTFMEGMLTYGALRPWYLLKIIPLTQIGWAHMGTRRSTQNQNESE